MDGRRWAEAREGEPERRASSSGHHVRLTASEGLRPVLRLQATAGNAAVTALLRDTRGRSVQRLWDTEDEPADRGAGEAADTEPGESTPEDGGAADHEAIDAVRSEVEAKLDPAAIVDTLAPYTASGGGLGDYETPGTGETAQALRIQRDPADQEGPPPRPGGPGDVLKALMPYLQPALDRLKANVLDALARLKAGEKIATIVVVAPIVIGPLTQPGPRRFALDQLNGTDVTFGVIPNLQIKPNIGDGQLRGGTLTYDLAPALRKLGVPW